MANDKKMVVAINIGTLVNFIESEQGKAFKKLKEYVVEAGIASGENLKQGYTAGSVFQHVSFSDYQVFTLTENGVKTEYLENYKFNKLGATTIYLANNGELNYAPRENYSYSESVIADESIDPYSEYGELIKKYVCTDNGEYEKLFKTFAEEARNCNSI